MDALEMTLLFDYYGELLTQRQRDCLDMRYNQDMSLGEIAQELGVSRQGVYDNLSRAETLLRNMEEKTGFLRRDERSTRLPSKSSGRRRCCPPPKIRRWGNWPGKSWQRQRNLRSKVWHLKA